MCKKHDPFLNWKHIFKRLIFIKAKYKGSSQGKYDFIFVR